MIVAIEHDAKSRYGNVIEMHCPRRDERAVAGVIRRITGEHPVPVPICDCTAAFFVKGLTLDEACAVLRMVTLYRKDPDTIDRSLIEAQMMMEHRSPDEIDLDAFRCGACAICQTLEQQNMR